MAQFAPNFRPKFYRAAALALAPLLLLPACGSKDSPVASLLAADIEGVAVNPYLWRATIDSLSFMNITQRDGSNGTIATDWYVSPRSPNERIRFTVNLTGQALTPDAVQVSAFRQVAQNGQWIDAPVAAATVQEMENIILTKARDLQGAAL